MSLSRGLPGPNAFSLGRLTRQELKNLNAMDIGQRVLNIIARNEEDLAVTPEEPAKLFRVFRRRIVPLSKFGDSGLRALNPRQIQHAKLVRILHLILGAIDVDDFALQAFR